MQPDFHFGIGIEGARCFYREMRDRTIGYGEVLLFLAGHALCILNDQSVGGEYPFIAEHGEYALNVLIADEQGLVLFFCLFRGDLSHVAQEGIDSFFP